MKKIIIIAATALISFSSFAQKAGELYVEGALGLGFGNVSTSHTVLDHTNKSSSNSFYFDFAPAVGYFVIDNLAVNGMLGVSYAGNSTALSIMPGIRYYLQLVDKIYYTPGLDLRVALNLYGGQENIKTSASYGLGASLGAFEYRPVKHIGVFANCLSFNYNYSRNEEPIPGTEYKAVTAMNTINLSLGATFGVRYIF